MNDNVSATTKPRGKHQFFQREDIDRLERMITDAPAPVRPLTTVDALTAIAPVLKKARDKGHTLDSLVKLCASQGLDVSGRSISRAISTAHTSKPAKKKTD